MFKANDDCTKYQLFFISFFTRYRAHKLKPIVHYSTLSLVVFFLNNLLTSLFFRIFVQIDGVSGRMEII